MAEALARRHHWTRAEWRSVVESGSLGKAHLVLRHGEIVEKMNIGSRHAHVVTRLGKQLVLGLAGGPLEVRVQQPIALADDDEPEPDITVCVDRSYYDDHPGPVDVVLVIEVADSSVRADRAQMVDYAAAGIPEAWIVDIGTRTVTIYKDPDQGDYTNVRRWGEGSVVAAGVTIALADLFPAG